MKLLQVATAIQAYGKRLAKDPRAKLITDLSEDSPVPRKGRAADCLTFIQVAARARSGAIFTRSEFLTQASTAILQARKAAKKCKGYFPPPPLFPLLLFCLQVYSAWLRHALRSYGAVVIQQIMSVLPRLDPVQLGWRAISNDLFIPSMYKTALAR